MDEQTKLIKSNIVLNIITVVAVIIILGLQIFQVVKSSDDFSREKCVTPIAQNQQQTTLPAVTQTQSYGTQAGGAMTPRTGTFGSTNPKCGDGTCDAMEKSNPNICPTDCK